MNKKETTPEHQQPAELTQLMAEGSVIVTGDSRQAVYDIGDALADAIPADTSWTRTIVVRDAETGIFSQIYSLTK